MMFVPIPQYTNLIILMLIKVEPIKLAILQLQEVVIQTLLTYPDLLRRFLKRLAILVVQVAPLLHLLYDLAYLPFFRSSATFAV